MNLNYILDKSLEIPPTPEEALFLFQKSRDVNEASKIFMAAAEIRDRELGRVFKLDGEIAPVTSCQIKPMCRYCTFSQETLTGEEVLAGLKLAEKAGMEDIRLSGGSDLASKGDEVIELVRMATANTRLRVHVNIGPVYSQHNLETLKCLGVIEVGSSLETINPSVFKQAKPGDSLVSRIETAQAIDRTGLKLQSIIMVGLGSSDKDYIEHLFFLKQLKNLSHLPISRFNPFKGTPMASRRRASPWEAARLCAVARLVLRTPDIRIAAGGGPDDIPLWLMAGGNRITSLFIHHNKCEPERFSSENPLLIERSLTDKLEVVDRSSICRYFAEDAGFSVYPSDKTNSI